MRILFLGSDEIACPSLECIHAAHEDEIVAVISQPDRPKGRHRKMAPCALKQRATELGLSCMSPEKIGDADTQEVLQEMALDLIVVVAYGQYIPQSVLAIPPKESINLHPSLLPKYRGAAPIQGAIANGEQQTGVTILYVSEEMDAGDIIQQVVVPIDDEDTGVSLSPKLGAAGADLLLQVLDKLRIGDVARTPQDESEATYVHKLTKEDGRIDWSMSADEIRNRVRAYQPWPGSFCALPGSADQFLRILRLEIMPGEGKAGEVLSVVGDGPVVATGKQAVRFL